jgi:hypothetical protein
MIHHNHQYQKKKHSIQHAKIHNLKFGFKTQISIHSPAGVLIR